MSADLTDALQVRRLRVESAVDSALDAWDALDPTTRGMTGPDFLTAMEAMRIEVFR